jgi:hypothetical protein
MSFYFNHSALENTSDSYADKYLNEVIRIKVDMRKNREELLFYQDFWKIDFCGMDIKDYMFGLKDREYAKEVINSVMNGPYYYGSNNTGPFKVIPEVNKNCFGNLLLGICFNDGQDKIISLKEDKDLNQKQYTTFNGERRQSVHNIIGCETLQEYFKSQYTFKCINDVFEKIEEEFKNIVILDNAKKSARKHDFRSCFDNIYNGILGLYKIELPLLVKGVNDEKRKEVYFERLKMEISKESEETLNIERYRREREFVIPRRGKVLFEWHIKFNGNNTRIHYYIDKKRRKVYIGHCGRHLSTAGYKS